MKQDMNESAIEKMIGTLPYYSPSANFNNNILSAMGFEVRPLISPFLKTWIQVIFQVVIASWIIILSVSVFYLLRTYAWDIVLILMKPSVLLANLKLLALKVSFTFLHILSFLSLAKDIVIRLLSNFNILPNLVISTILAGLAIMSISRHSIYSHMERK
jgi:hypothetical protein